LKSFDFENVLELEKYYKDILENIEEWAYIRLKVGFFLKNRNNKKIKIKNNSIAEKFKKVVSILLKIKDMFYGFKNWFGKYDYLFFSYSEQRKLINGRYKNKAMDDLIDKELEKKSLLIEAKNSKRFKKIYTKYVVGEEIIYFFSKIILYFSKKKFPHKEINRR